MQRESERHAIIYSVVAQDTGNPAEGLEAHAFVLNHIDPKTRKHRLRCIQRRKARTKLEVKIDQTIIVVIDITNDKVDVKASRQREEPDDSAGTDKPRPEVKVAPPTATVKEKTPYKRESDRLRRRARRQARRSAEARRSVVAPSSEDEDAAKDTGDHFDHDDMDTEFSLFLVTLWILHDETGSKKETLYHHANLVENAGSDNPRSSTLEEYLEQPIIDLKSIDDMTQYLKVRRAELITLKHHHARIPSAEQHNDEKLENLCREQSKYKKTSTEWNNIEEGPKREAKFQTQMVHHAKTGLPKIIASRKSAIRSVERKLSKARKALGSAEIRAQRDELVWAVRRYRSLISTVFPASNAYANLQSLWESAEADLADFNRKHPIISL